MTLSETSSDESRSSGSSGSSSFEEASEAEPTTTTTTTTTAPPTGVDSSSRSSASYSSNASGDAGASSFSSSELSSSDASGSASSSSSAVPAHRRPNRTRPPLQKVRVRRMPVKRKIKGRPKKNVPAKSTARPPVRPRGAKSKAYSEHVSSASESYSDGEDYGGDDDVIGQLSRSTATRVNSKVSSYKEVSDAATESDDLIEASEDAPPPKTINENAETIDQIMNTRMGLVHACGSRTTFYNCLDSGDPNLMISPQDSPRIVQYLIKWKGWSHIHNTWESEVNLLEQQVNGIKKLDNYKRKREGIDAWQSVASEEDIEYYRCQTEMMKDLEKEFLQVERIVRHQVSTTGSLFPDYLVKWKCLPYSECSWEDGALIQKRYDTNITQYELRQDSHCIPSKYCKVLKSRPKFVEFKEQPLYIGSEQLRLRDYQLAGLNWLLHSWCRNYSSLLCDEMGTGKTIQTISFLSALSQHFQLYGPFLIVVPLSTLITWQREFQIWAPPTVNVIVYIGDVISRTKIRENEWCHEGNKRLKFNVLLTTYEIALKDKTFLNTVNWAVLGVDEAHRLKNDDSLLYKCLASLNTNHRLLITGTPLQNTLKELWALLHFIMPDRFDSWESFESQHNEDGSEGFGGLHRELEPFLLRRVKKDVEKSLPAKIERILRIEMTRQQREYYRLILTRNYKALSKGVKGSISGFMNIIMELKKCCNHAFLVRSPDDINNCSLTNEVFESLVRGSGKLILLDKLLIRLKESGHRVLIFSQMVRMLDILAKYLQYRRFQYQRLDGSIKSELRKQAMDHFNAPDSEDFCFLLSTRAGGLGVNLATADTVIIFDSDWNPQNDLQAQARAHRIGQKKQVSVYRLVTKKSVEEDIIERAKKKMVLDHLVIQRMDTTGRTILSRNTVPIPANPFGKDELSAILKFGAEDLFKETDNDETELQVDIDDILIKAETHNTEDHMSASDELLSQFKVVSFDNLENDEIQQRSAEQKNWDQIIPEKQLKEIEEAEKLKEIQEMNLGPRQRKANHPITQATDDSDSNSEVETANGAGRGRRRTKLSAPLKSLSNQEIRRFIKSFKKFPRPQDRLESIAADAELHDKTIQVLVNLATYLLEQCNLVMKLQEQDSKVKPTVKLTSGVVINAKFTLQAIADLEPLALAIPPNDTVAFANFHLEKHTKPAHFDCPWSIDDDTNLLKGISEHGLGNWEAIKIDTSLHLYDKILPDGAIKPQAKQLQMRANYLLKLIGKPHSVASTTSNCPTGKVAGVSGSAKSRRSGHKVKDLIKEDEDATHTDASEKSKAESHHSSTHRDNDNTGGGSTATGAPPTAAAKKAKKSGRSREEKKQQKRASKKAAKKEAKRLKKQETATTAAPPSVDGGLQKHADLSPAEFNACKERMRPVKRALKQLDNPDKSLSDVDRMNHTRRCLIKIGSHIDKYLSSLGDMQAQKEWRSNLWYFVAKFFEEFNASQLYKLYKQASFKEFKTNEAVDLDDHKSYKRKHDSSSKVTESSLAKRPLKSEPTSSYNRPPNNYNSYRHESGYSEYKQKDYRSSDHYSRSNDRYSRRRSNERSRERYDDSSRYDDRRRHDYYN